MECLGLPKHSMQLEELCRPIDPPGTTPICRHMQYSIVFDTCYMECLGWGTQFDLHDLDSKIERSPGYSMSIPYSG